MSGHDGEAWRLRLLALDAGRHTRPSNSNPSWVKSELGTDVLIENCDVGLA